MSRKKIFITCDFSLNSPAILIENDGILQWITLTRYDNSKTTKEKIVNSKKSPYKYIMELSNMDVKFLERTVLDKKNYSQIERIKFKEYKEIIDIIKDSINNNIKEIADSDIYIGIEGLSFSSNGNYIIDITSATSLLKKYFIEDLLLNNLNNFFVFSPQSIKKFAGKGSYKKKEMYLSLIERNLINDEFINILRDNQYDWITNAGAVKPPISDLIDAAWIYLLLKETVNSENKKLSDF